MQDRRQNVVLALLVMKTSAPEDGVNAYDFGRQAGRKLGEITTEDRRMKNTHATWRAPGVFHIRINTYRNCNDVAKM
jgi:hypothetical protein